MKFKYLLLFILLNSPIFAESPEEDSFQYEESFNDLVSKNSYPLHQAIENEDIDTVITLIDQGYSIEERLPDYSWNDEGAIFIKQGLTPLETALEKRNWDIIKLLLDRGADPLQYRKLIIDYSYFGKNQVTHEFTTFFYDIINKYWWDNENKQQRQSCLDIIKHMYALNIDFNRLIYIYKTTNRNPNIEMKRTPLEEVAFLLKMYKKYNRHNYDKNEVKALKILENLLIECGAKS